VRNPLRQRGLLVHLVGALSVLLFSNEAAFGQKQPAKPSAQTPTQTPAKAPVQAPAAQTPAKRPAAAGGYMDFSASSSEADPLALVLSRSGNRLYTRRVNRYAAVAYQQKTTGTTTWLATGFGVKRVGPKGEKRLYTTEDGLPVPNVLAIAVSGEDVWCIVQGLPRTNPIVVMGQANAADENYAYLCRYDVKGERWRSERKIVLPPLNSNYNFGPYYGSAFGNTTPPVRYRIAFTKKRVVFSVGGTVLFGPATKRKTLPAFYSCARTGGDWREAGAPIGLDTGLMWQDSNQQPNPRSRFSVSLLLADAQEGVYVGSERGMFRYDTLRQTWHVVEPDVEVADGVVSRSGLFYLKRPMALLPLAPTPGGQQMPPPPTAFGGTPQQEPDRPWKLRLRKAGGSNSEQDWALPQSPAPTTQSPFPIQRDDRPFGLSVIGDAVWIPVSQMDNRYAGNFSMMTNIQFQVINLKDEGQRTVKITPPIRSTPDEVLPPTGLDQVPDAALMPFLFLGANTPNYSINLRFMFGAAKQRLTKPWETPAATLPAGIIAAGGQILKRRVTDKEDGSTWNLQNDVLIRTAKNGENSKVPFPTMTSEGAPPLMPRLAALAPGKVSGEGAEIVALDGTYHVARYKAGATFPLPTTRTMAVQGGIAVSALNSPMITDPESGETFIYSGRYLWHWSDTVGEFEKWFTFETLFQRTPLGISHGKIYLLEQGSSFPAPVICIDIATQQLTKVPLPDLPPEYPQRQLTPAYVSPEGIVWVKGSLMPETKAFGVIGYDLNRKSWTAPLRLGGLGTKDTRADADVGRASFLTRQEQGEETTYVALANIGQARIYRRKGQSGNWEAVGPLLVWDQEAAKSIQNYNRPPLLVYADTGRLCLMEGHSPVLHTWKVGQDEWKAHREITPPDNNFPDVVAAAADVKGEVAFIATSQASYTFDLRRDEWKPIRMTVEGANFFPMEILGTNEGLWVRGNIYSSLGQPIVLLSQLKRGGTTWEFENPQRLPFDNRSRNIQRLISDGASVWGLVQNDAYRRDARTGEWISVNDELKKFGDGTGQFLVRDIAPDPASGAVWVLLAGYQKLRPTQGPIAYEPRIARFDLSKQTWELVPPVEARLNPGKLIASGVHVIGGKVWMTTDRLVLSYTPLNQRWDIWQSPIPEGDSTFSRIEQTDKGALYFIGMSDVLEIAPSVPAGSTLKASKNSMIE
jgi:hypothetical protein